MKNKQSFDSLLAAVQKAKVGAKPDREEKEFYYPERDKSGNGFAVIRFLPSKDGESLPFVKVYSHSFKSDKTGKWYIEECPTTIGKQCPMCEDNAQFWVPGATEADKAEGRKRKRKMQYISNVLIVSDSKNPENEGKVMLFKYGSKIFDKISDAMSPPEPVEGDDPVAPVNIWDPEEGANFKFRIRKVEGQTNYDKSEFDAPSPIEGDVDAMLETAEDVQQFISPDRFKSYEKLAERHAFVTGKGKAKPAGDGDDDDSDADFARKAAEKAKKTDVKKPAKEVKQAKEESSESEDDDDLDYFRRMAAED